MVEDMYARADSEAGIDITRLVQLRKWSKSAFAMGPVP